MKRALLICVMVLCLLPLGVGGDTLNRAGRMAYPGRS